MFNPIVCSQLPEGFEYLVDEKIPVSSLTYTIVGMIIILAVAIALTVMVVKKHKLVGLCTFAGVSIFMLFNYFFVMILTMLIPAANKIAFIIIASLLSTLVPFMGRLIVIKAFSRQQNTFSSHVSYGVGIMNMKALVSLLTFVFPITNYYQLSKYGVEHFFPAGEDAEIALQRAENFADIFSYNYSQYMLVAIMVLGVMVYSLFASVSLYAAYNNKAGKGWYGFAFGMGFLVSLSECLYNNGILGVLPVILMIVAAVVTAVFSIRLYNSLEIEDEEEVKEKDEDISKYAKVKIPKFKDLDKL